ncbi:MAG: HD domain-containing protein [Treponemataceae bacterium]|nr:HD domain-containing protein [Treponemataceae bacterium]
MNEEIESFILEKVDETNQLLEKIFIATFGIGPFYFIMSSIRFFHVPLSFSLSVLAVSFVFGIIFWSCLKVIKKPKVVMLVGLINLCIIISFASATPALSVYLSFGIVPFLSCLYLMPKITILMTVICYFSMDLSIFTRAAMMFHGDMSRVEQMIGTQLGGYSIEFLVIGILSYLISKKLRDNLINEYSQKIRIENIQTKLIQSFANIVEWNDQFTGEHIKRTSTYVELIARQLVKQGHYVSELTEERIQLMTKAAPLHDIGKISVPNNILNKPGKLTDEEFEIMKSHSEIGYQILEKELKEMEDPEYIQLAEDMALYHHEKWNGQGYPRKIAGKEIPLSARIMAAADVLDALLSKRQYKDAFTIEKTMDIFKESSGSHFEPCIVEAVLALKDQIFDVSAGKSAA